MTKFDKSGCHILNSKSKSIATATKIGSLYFLNCQMNEHACVVTRKEDVWHRPIRTFGCSSLKQLGASQLVECFDYDSTKKTIFVIPVLKANTTEVLSQLVEAHEQENHLTWFTRTFVES